MTQFLKLINELKSKIWVSRSEFSWELLDLKQVGVFAPLNQLLLVVLFFTVFIGLGLVSIDSTNLLFGYPVSMMMLLAPIYEELIFRVGLPVLLSKHLSLRKTVILINILFGIWHLKNLWFIGWVDVLRQVVYATIIIGPFLTYVVLKTKSVWPGVIIHYLNNCVYFASKVVVGF